MAERKNRTSMSVDPENTRNLKAMFEKQLKQVEQSGNAVLNRRTRAPTGSRFTAKAPSASPPANRGSAPAPAPAPPANRGSTPATRPNQSHLPQQKQSAAPAMNPVNRSRPSNPPTASPVPSPSKPPEIKNPPPPQQPNPPPQPSPPSPRSFLDESGEGGQRIKPKVKPKADPNRMTVKLPNPPLAQPIPEQNPAPPSKVVENRARGASIYELMEVGDKYRIGYDELEFDELVSEGSAGEVYLGYYYGTPVAIKKLFALPDDQKHLVAREFSMLQGVNHPNIVQFLGICDHESGIYLITEYIEHGDLFDMLIFGTAPIPWKDKISISLQVAQATYYLHSRKIIHRDLKSQNILIGSNNKVKLCDLGLATVIETKKRMTVCGTNEWMAPEIVMAEEYNNKVDVFSFGIVLTEMITEQPPLKRNFDTMLAFNEEKFMATVPPDCPTAFSKLVIDCCKFKPEDRPDFKEIVARLKKLQSEIE